MIIGTAWYPEQWPESEWERDLRDMAEAGLKSVRLGEFAWARLEPAEGQYDLSPYERVLEIMHRLDMQAVLCTPTPTPPRWMTMKYPDLGFVNSQGYRNIHGARQHACYNHPDNRRHGLLIVEEMARTFSKHPNVFGWQIDNELRGHQKLCFCEYCERGWHQWLEARYGTIEALNEAWSTYVWSHRYNAFNEVQTPMDTCYYCQAWPVQIDYRRYMDETVVDFLMGQVEVIRKYTQAPITHNSEFSVDHHHLFRDLDIAAGDIYVEEQDFLPAQFRMDDIRGAHPSRREYWTLESGPMAGGETLHTPGYLRANTFLNQLSGAQLFSYWSWRQHTGGAEQDHIGAVYASGQKGFVYEEIKQASAHTAHVTEVLKDFERAPAEVALVSSYTNAFFYYSDGSGGLESDFNWQARHYGHYESLHACGAFRIILSDRADFQGYKVITTPYLPYLCETFLENITAFVEAGGVWIAGPYSGYRGAHHNPHTDFILGQLESLTGVRTLEYCRGASQALELPWGASGTQTITYCVFEEKEGVTVHGRYAGGCRFDGQPWCYEVALGKGKIIVPGSELPSEDRTAFYRHILSDAGVSLPTLPPKVRQFPLRDKDGKEAWALCNTDTQAVTIDLPSSGHEHLEDKAVGKQLEMPTFGTAILTFS